MAAQPIFTGVVTAKGALILDARRDLARYLCTLSGKAVEVIVRKVQVKRSRDQNSYLHGVVFPLLGEHFGMTMTEVKYSLMGECWGWKRDPISSKEIPIKPSTSEMTVEDCTHFIEWVLVWAATDHQVYIPSPEKVQAA